MNWIYTNNTHMPVIYRSETWLPDETHEIPYPVPSSLGLTCIQEGDTPDPVLFHDDIIIQPNTQEVISLRPPTFSHVVDLTIGCMTPDGGCECRFNSPNNCVIPIDMRGFQQVTSWENCSRIYFFNSTDTEVHISVTAFEVVR